MLPHELFQKLVNLGLLGGRKPPHFHLPVETLFDLGDAARREPAAQVIRRASEVAKTVVLEHIQRVREDVA